MLNTKYNLSKKILKNISSIERLYGQLESQVVPKELLLNLEKHNLVKSSFSSNGIEGNPLSQEEVTNLILGGRVPANRDEKEVKNYFDILKQIGKEYDTLDIDTILKIHKQLLEGVENEIGGEIRDRKVVVGNPTQDGTIVIKHEPPKHTRKEIEDLLKELLDWTNTSEELPILKAGIYHHEFVYIHPFIDGNGRVCRLTTTLLLDKLGYEINKYFILDDYYDIDRIMYSDSLHSADSGDKTEWLEYFTDGVKYSLQSSLAKIEEGLKGISFDMRPTNREKNVLELIRKYKEITSSDVSKDLKISRQQAFNLLDSLVSKGYLEKRGSTKNSFYILR
ncbi:MAG TPA: Fic family protein [Candidatus Dojkabacteria bacterium]|nr:Fic family protein [Candidatus Dojkabacteria bacterium]